MGVMSTLARPRLQFHTFEDHGILRLGQDRKFVFEQVEGEMGVDFYNMLRERSPRPVVTAESRPFRSAFLC